MHKRYLVMHSTAKEFTKGYNGLYPTKNNWYYDKIHVYERDNRYFRYIIGHEAELFIKQQLLWMDIMRYDMNILQRVY